LQGEFRVILSLDLDMDNPWVGLRDMHNPFVLVAEAWELGVHGACVGLDLAAQQELDPGVGVAPEEALGGGAVG